MPSLTFFADFEDVSLNWVDWDHFSLLSKMWDVVYTSLLTTSSPTAKNTKMIFY